jgi:tryptophanyl-tRNA synthetase
VEVLNNLIEPIRSRRKRFEQNPSEVIDALRLGTTKANELAEETLALAKKAMRQDYFPRNLKLA